MTGEDVEALDCLRRFRFSGDGVLQIGRVWAGEADESLVRREERKRGQRGNLGEMRMKKLLTSKSIKPTQLILNKRREGERR